MQKGVDTTSPFEEKFWGPDIVAQVVAAKADQRNLKDRAMNCFVLQVENPVTKENEVENFAKALKESIDKGNFAEGGRFQLLVQCGAHWTPIDVTIKDGKPNLIILDSAADPSQDETPKAFRKHIPDCNVYQFVDTDKSPQMDNCSCSRFSLDAVFKLQNIDALAEVHKQMALTKPSNYGKAGRGDDVVLRVKDLPPSFAFYYRNTQSWTTLNKLPQELKGSPINKKHESLIAHAEAGSVMEERKGEMKKMHKSIDNVKTKLTENTTAFLAKQPDVPTIQASRQGIDYISKSQAQRQQMDQQQTSKYTPEQKMGALSREFVRNNPVEEKSFLKKILPASKEEKEVKKAQQVVNDVNTNKVTDKTRDNFAKVLPEQAKSLEAQRRVTPVATGFAAAMSAVGKSALSGAKQAPVAANTTEAKEEKKEKTKLGK